VLAQVVLLALINFVAALATQMTYQLVQVASDPYSSCGCEWSSVLVGTKRIIISDDTSMCNMLLIVLSARLTLKSAIALQLANLSPPLVDFTCPYPFLQLLEPITQLLWFLSNLI